MAARANPFHNVPQNSSFELEAGRPASHQIFDWLKGEIILGHIPPGTTLSEANLCHHFGVSRQPVREALLRLSTQSLVQVYPQRGSVVTKISVPMVLRAQLIREAVEVEVLKRAIENSTPEFLSDLAMELKLQETFAEAGDIGRFFKSDQDFHRRISIQSGVRGLWENLQDTRSQLDRARHAELESNQRLDILIAQHRRIFEGITKGDVFAAEKELRVHLRRITEKLRQTVDASPDWFEDADLVP